MNAMEMKLMREFKQQQLETENFFMTDISDIMAEYANEKGKEKYNNIKDLCSKLKEILNKITDIESFNNNINEYNKNKKLLQDKIFSINEYFDTGKEFSEENLKLIGKTTKSHTDKLHEIIIMAELLSYNKTANNLRFQFKKLVDSITYIINTSVDSTIRIYKLGMNDLIEEVGNLTDKKADLIKSFIPDEEEVEKEIDKKTIKKIFNYKKMNKLVKMNGYEPVRQTGDHLIYTNNNGSKTIPVPQHELGKGLSSKIQKQIS